MYPLVLRGHAAAAGAVCALMSSSRCCLSSQRYYHGRISREQAVERLVENGYDGSFLLRMSETQDGVYTISIMLVMWACVHVCPPPVQETKEKNGGRVFVFLFVSLFVCLCFLLPFLSFVHLLTLIHASL